MIFCRDSENHGISGNETDAVLHLRKLKTFVTTVVFAIWIE